MTEPTAGLAPLGAAPEDWRRLDAAGLTEDLLPVVADTAAKIHPSSKLRDVGKTPSRYDRGDLVVGIPGWTQHKATARQVSNWSGDPRLGICLQTRRVRAIDVDIGDPVHSARVRELVEMLAGVLPCRGRANSGKLLLAFDLDGDFSKRVIRTEHGIIEFLAGGQQFIAHGTHSSGSRYEWEHLGVVEVLGGFPSLSPAEFEALWSSLQDVFGSGDQVALRTGVLPRVPRSKLDMHGDQVVAFLDENDWVREFDRDGRVHVRCPWEGEHSGDSGPSATSWFPAGVGGFAQGHFKCLHAHCAHRTDDEFLTVTGYHDTMFEVVEVEQAVGEAAEPEPWPVFVRDKSGAIESTVDNTVKALGRPDVCGARLAYDAFKDQVMVGWGDTWQPVTDRDYTQLRLLLERRGFKAPGKELVRDALDKVAYDNQFDSAIQWARSLEWDGVPRVATFFSRLFNVADTPYTRAVGMYLWSALAGRCVEPGCKADMVPVLVSGQGTRKTSMVEALAPEPGAFVEINLEHRDDNLARSLRGKLVGELAELRGLATRDAESIKAWITRRVEEWTPKWREHATRFPRRLVFIGTGNNKEFLDDPTGERRWLPLEVGAVNVEAICAERDQLWAEGLMLFDSAGVQWQEAQALAADEHGAFKVSDTWQDDIEQWLKRDEMEGLDGPVRGSQPLRMRDVLVGALRLNAQQITRREELRVAKALRALGYERCVMRIGNEVTRMWCATENCSIPQIGAL